MTKRLYIELEETVTRRKKGWVEVDNDFTQVYSCFQHISTSIENGKAYQLLFWLLANESNKQNGFRTDNDVFNRFNNYLVQHNSGTVSKSTFYRLVEELTKAKAINKVGRGFYYFSPYIFWQDDKEKRLQFVEAEYLEGKQSYNPLLGDADIE